MRTRFLLTDGLRLRFSKQPGMQGGPDMCVDRLTLSFPLRSYEFDFDSWKSVSYRPRIRIRRFQVGGACATLSVYHTGASPTGSLDFNPARVHDPDGFSTCPWEFVYEAARKAFQGAHALVAPEVCLPEAGLARLDLARDFHGVTQAVTLIEGLAHAPSSRVRGPVLYFGRGGAQTLTLRNKRGAAVLYNKHLERPDRVPEGVLRFEAQSRHNWIRRYGGMEVLGDLTEERGSGLLRNRWDWSGMGAPVTAMPRGWKR